MRRLFRDESGFSVVELLIASFITVILVTGLSNLFVSGLRASSDASSRLTSQSGVRLAFDRLEYETRCASSATLLSGGTGVTLVLPSPCIHAQGTYTWCVTGGELIRSSGSSCLTTGQIFVESVTSATPFSCVAPVNQYPRLQVALTVDDSSSGGDSFSATDQIDMHNADLTTSSSTACS